MDKLGKGFGEQIREERKRKSGAGRLDIKGHFREPRLAPFYVVFVVGLGILLVRLFWVTVVQGGYYLSLSEENRIREDVVWAPRGIIYDRHGEELVVNKPIYRTYRADGTYEYFAREEMLKKEAEGEEQEVEEFVTREYPYGAAFAHVVGYVGEADREDVREEGMRLGSLVGKTGLEQTLDVHLRGEEGKRLVETDAVGRKLKVLGEIEARPGTSITTTLDNRLQVKAAGVLGQAQDGTAGRPGAVVASTPEGEILVLYSGPSFNPNVFAGGGESRRTSGAGFKDKRDIESLLRDSARPLFNRAIGGVYPPGSTFKPIVAVAALEEGAITGRTKFEDTGVIRVGSYRYRNWLYTQYGRTEGEVDVVKGIKRSVDTFFYRAGAATGIDKIAEWGRKFGVGKATGIELAGEAVGRMPDRDWKEKEMEERWFLGDTYHVSIGQGNILTTPLQVNMWAAAIANKGKLCKPSLIKTNGKDQRSDVKEEKCTDLGISGETLELVEDGMRQACLPGGTGFPLFNFTVSDEGAIEPSATESAKLTNAKKIAVGCKTGTAEYGDPEKTHAWFTVFAPLGEPEIVVTVLLEGGGSGAYDAAPVAKEILGEYFRQ